MSTTASSGGWTEILVGHQRPRGLGVIAGAAAKRGNTALAHYQFSDLLRQQQTTSLAPQEGVTADDIKDAFRWGAEHHRQIGEVNGVIQSSYQASHEAGSQLLQELNTIAHDGNSRINHIQASQDPVPIKIGKITDVVMDCQTQANLRAATRCDDVFNQIQTVLDKRGVPVSARQFAKNLGFDPTFGSPNREAVQRQVETVLNQSGAPPSIRPAGNRVPPPDAPAAPPAAHPANIGSSPPPCPRYSAGCTAPSSINHRRR